MRTAKEPSPIDVSESLWSDLIDSARHDDGAAVRDHLNAGFPVYYIEDDTPDDLLIKEHPSGRRELVRFNETGDDVIRVL